VKYFPTLEPSLSYNLGAPDYSFSSTESAKKDPLLDYDNNIISSFRVSVQYFDYIRVCCFQKIV